MLTSDDLPTIRFAIRWRLDSEPGATVLDTLVQPIKKGEWYTDFKTRMDVLAREDFIRVVVLTGLGVTVPGINSEFHLPDPFEHGHLVNEIDEIAESLKEVRRGAFTSPLMAGVRRVKGTGVRGGWDRYGTLMGRHG